MKISSKYFNFKILACRQVYDHVFVYAKFPNSLDLTRIYLKIYKRSHLFLNILGITMVLFNVFIIQRQMAYICYNKRNKLVLQPKTLLIVCYFFLQNKQYTFHIIKTIRRSVLSEKRT